MTSTSGDRPIDDELLVRYLLGTLAADEAERLDELSIADDEVAWRLRAVENDLVDAYVRGELSGETHERFLSSYLASPRRRDKVEFAEALLAYGQRRADGRATAGEPVSAAGPRQAAADVSSRVGFARALPQWALAAAALIAVAGATYVVVQNQRLRDEVSRTEAERAAVERAAQGLRTELERERSTSAAIRDELARLRESLPSVRVPSLRPFLLLPMRRGGAGQIATVSLTAGVEQVPFRLRLESDDFPRYDVSLGDPATGRVIWRSGRQAAASDGAARHVDLSVPAALLKAQNYTLDLAGHPAAGPAELVSSYAFRVERE